MKKYILSICTLAAICIGCVTVTSCSDPDDLNDLVLDRILSPTNITARISQDVNIIVSWDEMKGASSYEIVVGFSASITNGCTPELLSEAKLLIIILILSINSYSV